MFEGSTTWAGPILLVSGAGIAATDVQRYGLGWLRTVGGWSVLAKLGLVAVGVAEPALWPPVLWTCLVIGVLISHAPGAIRHGDVPRRDKDHPPPQS